MRKFFTTAVACICLVGLAACAQQSASSSSVVPGVSSHHHTLGPKGVYGGIGPSAVLQVLLGDAPPDLGGNTMSALNIGLKEVDGIENGQTTVLAQFSTPYVVNVLLDPGDDGQVVADVQGVRSDYQQLRLVVDLPSSTGVFTNGNTMPVSFQTGQKSMSTVGAGTTTTTMADGDNTVDIVVNQPFSIPQNGDNAVRVDFNAFESLTLSPSGALVSQPALFVAPIDEAGSINGTVVDSNGNPVSNAVVVAYGGSDGSIGNTVTTDSKGAFAMHTLSQGQYTLKVYNDYVNAAGLTVISSSPSQQQFVTGPPAVVNGGQDTNVGTIQD